MLRIEQVTRVDQLDRASLDQWNLLPLPSTMQSPQWLLGWWNQFLGTRDARNYQLSILLVYDGDRLIGVAPWYLHKRRLTGWCLRFLADGLVCSDHATILAHPHDEDQVVDELAKWLRQTSATVWDTIQFESIVQDEQAIDRLLGQLREMTIEAQATETTGSWVVDLPSTWEQYLASLSKNHRKRCRRWQRTYYDSMRAQIVQATSEDAQAYWNRLSELNLERRRLLGDRSAFLDRGFQDFHRTLAPELISSGQAELRALMVDAKLVAIEYILIQRSTMFCYQSGMKTSGDRDGYGNLSLLALFRDAIDRGFHHVDFLRGDEDYKSHWGARRVSVQNHTARARTLAGMTDTVYSRAIDYARSLRSALTPVLSTN